MAGAVPLAFACAGVSGDVEEAGIRWGQPEKGGSGRWWPALCRWDLRVQEWAEMLRKQELGGASRKKVGLDGGMAGAVPLGFACGGVSEDVEEAGIRWGATAEGGGEGV